ncbi:MAG: cell division protein FtsZ [Candidatus Binatia bacterium]|nr:cell division protein FtsZ [Candidatus Binatia bacterium]
MHGMEGEARVGARIVVIGVGGAGGNALNTMIERELQGVEFIAATTDMQELAANLAPAKIQLGEKLTRGLGAGGNPEIGREAALETVDAVRRALQGADMVFVAAGMGGGTGTGAAPVIAKVARELGALVVGLVMKPFSLEGRVRLKRAEEGIRALEEVVDSLMVIPNERLMSVVERGTFVLDALRRIDDVLYQAVRGVADLVTVYGFINLDFADVRAVMAEGGRALMGWASASGPDRAIQAAQAAISSKLLEGVSLDKARGLLINIMGGPTLAIDEVIEAATAIQRQANEDANVYFGAVFDETLVDELRVTVLATGFRAEDVDALPKPGAGKLTAQALAVGDGDRPATQAAPAGSADRRKQRVFVGTIEETEDGPRLRPAQVPGVPTTQGTGPAPEPSETRYVLDENGKEFDENDLSIPAFLRRSRG